MAAFGFMSGRPGRIVRINAISKTQPARTTIEITVARERQTRMIFCLADDMGQTLPVSPHLDNTPAFAERVIMRDGSIVKVAVSVRSVYHARDGRI